MTGLLIGQALREAKAVSNLQAKAARRRFQAGRGATIQLISTPEGNLHERKALMKPDRI